MIDLITSAILLISDSPMCNLVWSEIIWKGLKKNTKQINKNKGCEHIEPLRHWRKFCYFRNCFNGFKSIKWGELYLVNLGEITDRSLYYVSRSHWAFLHVTHPPIMIERKQSGWILMQISLEMRHSQPFPQISFSWNLFFRTTPGPRSPMELLSLSRSFFDFHTFTGGSILSFTLKIGWVIIF